MIDKPKEDYRNVIVTGRRGGKTYKLFKKCLDELTLGKSVIFLSPFMSNSHFSCSEFKYFLRDSKVDFKMNVSALEVTLPNGSVIHFNTFDNYKSGKLREKFRGLYCNFNKLYKVADNVDYNAWFQDLDAISLNGVEE